MYHYRLIIIYSRLKEDVISVLQFAASMATCIKLEHYRKVNLDTVPLQGNPCQKSIPPPTDWNNNHCFVSLSSFRTPDVAFGFLRFSKPD